MDDMDDLRVGLLVRALRRRRGWRQVDLARPAGVSQSTVSLLERGHLDSLPLRRVRQILGGLDARLELEIRWRGGDLDAVADAGHAALVERAARALRDMGWQVAAEVSYSHYGERGSIDLIAFHPPSLALLVIEVKTSLTSIEETLRRLDVKVRNASRVARERFGWPARSVSRVLVLPDSTATRDRLRRHAATFESAVPARGREVRSWLRAPHGRIDGRWLLRDTRPRGGTRVLPAPKRVRVPRGPRVEEGPST